VRRYEHLAPSWLQGSGSQRVVIGSSRQLPQETNRWLIVPAVLGCFHAGLQMQGCHPTVCGLSA
jgi:hypothetical protein